jgi:survival-of-motor-neuron-related-splicing factor 30|tara:strand:- start:2242 stop:2370 length:129 start_codon:yes stop_codon:yes gene_type:complete
MAELKALKDAHWLKKDEVRKEEETLAAWEQQVGREDAALDAN